MAIDLNDPEVKAAIEAAIKTQSETVLKAAVQEAVAGLKAKNDELLKKVASGKITEEELVGIEKDRKELEEFRTTQASAEEERALKAGEFEKLKEQIVTKFTAEMQAEKDTSTKLRTALEANLIDAAALQAISDAKGSTVILLPHVKRHIKMVEQDGKFVARVIDPAGTMRIGDDQGNPMTISQLVDEMKTDKVFAPVFEGSGAAGGGANNGSTPPAGAKTMTRTSFEQLNPVQKSAYMKDGGTLTND